MIEDNIIDAIVPIYCDDDFMGTGFIYKSYLITAAHVVTKYYDVDEGYSKIEYVFQGHKLLINPVNRVYKKWFKGKCVVYGNFEFNLLIEDVAIYKVESYCDCILFDKEGPLDGLAAKLYGFHFDKGKIELNQGNIELFYENTLPNGVKYTLDYCLFGKRTDSDLDIIPGYSGGPVLYENKVSGMLFGHFQDRNGIDNYHLMRPDFIMKKILEYEQQK